MSLESGLRSYLLANTALAAAVGNKVYPGEAPDGAVEPFIVYWLYESEEPRLLNGQRRYQKCTYEVQCCAVEYNDATALGDTVKAAVGGANSDSVEATLDGIDVIMHWADQPIHRKHVQAQDRTRNQIAFDLVIMAK